MVHPTTHDRVYFENAFHQSNKDLVMDYVITTCNIPNLTSNYSSEGGFNLPLTSEWTNVKLNNKQYLHYHSNSRQLRFITDNNTIIGLRFKDGINYMTDHELFGIVDCVENAVKNLNIKVSHNNNHYNTNYNNNNYNGYYKIGDTVYLNGEVGTVLYQGNNSNFYLFNANNTSGIITNIEEGNEYNQYIKIYSINLINPLPNGNQYVPEVLEDKLTPNYNNTPGQNNPLDPLGLSNLMNPLSGPPNGPNNPLDPLGLNNLMNPLSGPPSSLYNSYSPIKFTNPTMPRNTINPLISSSSSGNNFYNMSNTAFLNLTSDQIIKTIVKYYYYKLLDNWLHGGLSELLSYVVIKDGKAQFIKSMDDFKIKKIYNEDDESENRTNKKIKFIKEVITKDVVKHILKKIVKKKEINWSHLNKHEAYIQKVFLEYLSDLIEEIIKDNNKNKD